MGHINKHTHLVHPLHALLAEHGQATVVILLHAITQSVALRIGHAQLTDAQTVEDIDAIHFIFNGSCALNARHPGDLASLLGSKNVINRLALDQKILMSKVAQPHSQIMNNVDPLPAAGTGDDIHTVHHIVEDAVNIGIGQCFITADSAALPHGIINVVNAGHILWVKCRVIVKADVRMLLQDLLHHGFLIRLQLYNMASGPVPLCPFDLWIVLALFQIFISLITLVSRFLYKVHQFKHLSS